MSVTPLTRLLPLACVAAAVCLFASELMTTFEFTPPGGEAICDQAGADRHGNALALLAVFALVALAITLLASSKPAAIAVAASGGVALLFFLLLDLPDANAAGTIGDSCGSVTSSFYSAEAVPQGGFFLEMAGALGLAITGIALATMTPEQLAAIGPGRWVGGGEARKPAAPADAPGSAGREGGETESPHRTQRRPRTRQRG